MTVEDGMSNIRELLPSIEASELPPDMQILVHAIARRLAESATMPGLWETSQTATYWILLISSSSRPDQMAIAREALAWSALSARSRSRLICFQSSDTREFQLCTRHFGVNQFPCLLLGTSPQMSTYVVTPKTVMERLTAQEGGLHELMTEIHTAISTDAMSLADVSKRLLRDRASSFAGLVYKEVKGILSLKGSADLSVKV